MVHWIESTFGTSDLYEILSCPRDADRGALRRAYYRAALRHHPDKQQQQQQQQPQNNSNGGGGEGGGTSGDPKRFQAISLAYQILENPATRAEYDETGAIPGDDALGDDDGDFGGGASDDRAGVDRWREYFDRIFGRVTASKIDAFAQKYKCSDEERRDVLAAFAKCRGNLAKMVDVVLVSEYRDADRWVSDYLQPAMASGALDRQFETAMNKSLKVCRKKAAQQDKEQEEEDDDDQQEMVDDEETESDDALEGEEDDKEQKKQPRHKKGRPASSTASKKSPKKAGKTKSKPKNKMDDLVAAIQNKRGGAGGGENLFASLGARYGVNMDGGDEDPLAGERFDKAQAKMLKSRGRKK
jgi:DnaJ family protein C protein 9